MNTLTIELPKETAEKLDLLKQAYEKKTGASISESTLVQTLISKEFIQAITPFDLQQFITGKNSINCCSFYTLSGVCQKSTSKQFITSIKLLLGTSLSLLSHKKFLFIFRKTIDNDNDNHYHLL